MSYMVVATDKYLMGGKWWPMELITAVIGGLSPCKSLGVESASTNPASTTILYFSRARMFFLLYEFHTVLA